MPYTDIYDVNVYKQVYTHHVVYKYMLVSVSVCASYTPSAP